MPACIGCHVAMFCGLLFGAGPAPDLAETTAQLDLAIEAKWLERGIVAEGLADDATFLRRVWLDLAGRVPSALVVREFLDDRRADKRVRLVANLLASEDFAEHWARAWSIRLTEKRPIRHAVHDGHVLQMYLRDGLMNSKSYRQFTTELICGDGAGDASGPANFLLRYDARPEPLAGAVGKHFLGTTLQCAQCHDHVFAPWKQEDFRGLAAFFGRLKMMTSDDGNLHAVVESRRGEFQIIEPGAKPGNDGTIPMTTVVPRLPATGMSSLLMQKPRRQRLAEWVTASDNPWFARHAVNSTWRELFGTPLVAALDDPAAAAKSDHGAVLDLLARDFVAGDFDLKRLIRGIVLSRAYQRAAGAASADRRAPPATDLDVEKARLDKLQWLAVFPVRSLTVDQLYYSINQATGNRSSEEAVVEGSTANESLDADDEEYSDRPVEALGEYEVGMQRALALLNSPFAHEAVQSGARIAATMHGSRIGRAHVEWLFLATLARPPTKVELKEMLELVRGDRGTKGLEDVLWVLLNSAEFNTNH